MANSWSDGTPGVSRGWDDASRLLSISNIFSAIDYGYDDAGQVTWEGTDVNGSGARREVRYWRYPNGDVAKVIYPNGLGIERSYTERGQLKTVKDSSQDLVTYHYLKDGKVDFQSYGNGMETVFGYDDRGFIGSVTHRRGATELSKRTYWRDKRDRIVAWEKGVNPSANPRETGLGDRYEYDEAGQLTKAAYQAQNAHVTATSPERADDFHYDAMGNRQGWNRVASRGGLMEFKGRNNKLNQYESWANNYPNPPAHWGVMMWYDDAVTDPPSAPWVPYANGVLMGDGWNVADFNALNQPSSMWSFAYEGTQNWMFFGFDPVGRCVKRWKGPSGDPNTTAATFFYYDGWNLIQEGPGGTLVDRTYVHGARVDEIVASRVSGTWYNHHYDGQGNCILLSNASGGIQEQYDYDAFGFPYVYNAAGGKGNAQTRFLFTGREWISDLRLYDYRARMYQPELGRFLQPDPQEFIAGDYNLYRYCHNDPVNKSDPTGLREQIAGDIIWDMARYADAANTSQGSFKDFTNGAYMGAIGGGGDGGGDGGRRYSFAQVSRNDSTSSGNSDASKGAHFVPQISEVDGKTVLPETSDHTGNIYKYPLKIDGHRVTGGGWTVEEKLKKNYSSFKIKKALPESPLPRSCIFTDHVGLDFRPSRGFDGSSSKDQSFIVKHNGVVVDVPTVFRQVVTVKNGEIGVVVTLITP